MARSSDPQAIAARIGESNARAVANLKQKSSLWGRLVAVFKSAVQKPMPQVPASDSRSRDIINESLDIALKTKRRDTAESRLDLAEQLLNEIDQAGRANGEDRVNRHTLARLREGMAVRFDRAKRRPA